MTSIRLIFFNLVAIMLFFISACSENKPVNQAIPPTEPFGLNFTSIIHSLPINGNVKFEADDEVLNPVWVISGSSYSGKIVYHNFAEPGSYEVILTGDNGKKYTGTIIIQSSANLKIDASLGENHTIMNLNSQAYLYGDSEKGQLCTNDISIQSVKRPLHLKNYNQISSIAAGKAHTLFVNDGVIYSCGDNSLGQLGRNTNEITSASPKPIEHTFSNDFNNIIVAAGGNLSLFSKNFTDGEAIKSSLYYFGFNGDGGAKLTIPTILSQREGAGIVENLPGRQDPQIVAGENFALIRSTGSFNLFSFGVNDKWQLGRSNNQTGNNGNYANDNPDTHTSSNATSMRGQLVFTEYGGKDLFSVGTPEYYTASLQDNEETSIAAGKDFSIVMRHEAASEWSSEVHDVYVWGNNDKNQLGFENKSGNTFVRRPTILFSKTKTEPAITDDEDKDPNAVKPIKAEIIQVAAGTDFGLALDKNNNLYAWGNSDDNSWIKGTPTIEQSNVFMLNGSYKKIWAGSKRVLALTIDDKLVTWGDNTNSILGVGSSAIKIEEPTEILFSIAE